MQKTNEYIILHHSAVKNSEAPNQLEGINRTHQQRFNMKSRTGLYVGYHYLIEADGQLYQTRYDDEIGAHCKEESMNYKSIGICLAGNFDEEDPTIMQLQTLKNLILELRIKYNIPRENVKRHTDYADYKTCPGAWFSDNNLNSIIMLREIVRTADGSYWFIKNGKEGKQQVPRQFGPVMTIFGREFGTRQVDEKYLSKFKDAIYF